MRREYLECEITPSGTLFSVTSFVPLGSHDPTGVVSTFVPLIDPSGEISLSSPFPRNPVLTLLLIGLCVSDPPLTPEVQGLHPCSNNTNILSFPRLASTLCSSAPTFPLYSDFSRAFLSRKIRSVTLQ